MSVTEVTKYITLWGGRRDLVEASDWARHPQNLNHSSVQNKGHANNSVTPVPSRQALLNQMAPHARLHPYHNNIIATPTDYELS